MSLCQVLLLMYVVVPILSTCHFVNLPFHQYAISSICHFVNFPFCQFTILSICHFVNLPFCQFTILSICHFINLPFCQFNVYFYLMTSQDGSLLSRHQQHLQKPFPPTPINTERSMHSRPKILRCRVSGSFHFQIFNRCFNYSTDIE
jgi:hypothetical protein